MSANEPKADDKAKSGDNEGKDAEQEQPEEPAGPPSPAQYLEKVMGWIERSVVDRDRRLLMRVLRYTNYLRQNLTASELAAAADVHVTDLHMTQWVPEALEPLMTAEDKAKAASAAGAVAALAPAGVAAAAAAAAAGAEDEAGDADMEGGDAAAAKQVEEPDMIDLAKVTINSAAEREVYLFFLVVALQLREGHNEAAAENARRLADHAMAFNRRTMDLLLSRAFALLGLAHGRLGSLASVSGYLLAAHRTAVLRHDEDSHAVLVCILLRDYVARKQYAIAEKLLDMEKDIFPSSASNAQLVRFLYYRGKVQAATLQYSKAARSLTQALRKAPTGSAAGFRRQAQKTGIIVQLLMGEVPDRSVFSPPGDNAHMAQALAPYLELTRAVRTGDVKYFERVLDGNRAQFERDDTLSLICRLRNNVIRAGLRSIALAYSAISFADISKRLGLGSAEDARFLCAKAIRDGVIDARLDPEAECLRTKEEVDVYNTSAPHKVFHSRIKAFLSIHSDAVRGMRYPKGAFKRDRMGGEGTAEEEAKEEATAADNLEEDEEFDDEDMDL